MATTLITPRSPRLDLLPRRVLLRELRASRRRALLAVQEERRRLERDLHDGLQQRLVALRIRLGLAAELLAREPQTSGRVLAELAEETQGALDELRYLVHHEHPPLLAEGGLVAALADAARASPARTRLDAAGVARHEPAVEAAVYFTCLEALQNALKHAGPDAEVRIGLSERRGKLCFQVSDTGPGFDPAAAARHPLGGLANMRARLASAGGAFEIRSRRRGGTTVAGSLPTRNRTAT